MTAIIITAVARTRRSCARSRALRDRGIGVVVVSLDAPARSMPARTRPAAELQRQRSRALRHALAEYELGRRVGRSAPGAGPLARGPADRDDRRRRADLRRPAGGLASRAASSVVVLLGLVLAWAMDDPAWVNGRAALTDCLPLCALLGVAVGFAGPQARLGPLDDPPGRARCSRRWSSPSLAGMAIAPGASIPEAFRITADGTVDAYLDLAWRGQALTGPGGPLHPRPGRDRVGDDAVRGVRRLRPPATAVGAS